MVGQAHVAVLPAQQLPLLVVVERGHAVGALDHARVLGGPHPPDALLLAVHRLVVELHGAHGEVGLRDVVLGLIWFLDEGDPDGGDLLGEVEDQPVVVLDVGVGLHHEGEVAEGGDGAVPLGDHRDGGVDASPLRHRGVGVRCGPGGVAVRGVEVGRREEHHGVESPGQVVVAELMDVDVPVEAVVLLHVVEVALPEGEAPPVRQGVY